MSEDLSNQVDNFAIYLPSLPLGYAREAVRRQGANGLPRPADLNFLNRRGKLFHYPYVLATAADYAYSRASNMVTQRDPATFIMGDSGGYQVGTGALRGTGPWRSFARDTKRVMAAWRSSDAKAHLLRWQELRCTFATILDMPLWARGFGGSPFRYCSVEQLTELTVENLRYIDENRGKYGNIKFLNVLQGETEEAQRYWVPQVCPFQTEGWAYGTKIKNSPDDLPRLLKTVLYLRDEGLMGGRYERFHILGLSRLVWSVALTGIQRGIQNSTGSPFMVTFDSSTPFQWATTWAPEFVVPPLLTADRATWRWSKRRFPQGFAAANERVDEPFPEGSPISKLLTIGDMNPKRGKYLRSTFGPLSILYLANHNLYVFIRGMLDANVIAFGGGAAPQSVADLIGLIERIFQAESWQSTLTDFQDAIILAMSGADS